MRNEIPLLNILFRIEDGEDVGNSKNLFENAYNVIRLQDVKDASHCLKRVHRCGFNGIYLQLEGKSIHHLDEKNLELEKNDLLFLREFQVHQLCSLSDNSKGYLLIFSHFFYETFTEKTFLASFSFFSENNRDFPVQKISKQAAIELKDIFEHSITEFTLHNTNKRIDQILWAYLHILLIKTEQSIGLHESNYIDHGTPLFLRFEELLQENFAEHLSVANYAEMLSISPNYLNHICKKIHGKNAKRIIDERLLLEAKRQLFSGKQSVSEIAFNLNFKDASYFSRFFKKLSGENPETYRNKHILE
ncbi:helix-turn-helix domain-containing protein [Chondrinema litorale]|uniref:helix-turn-helix domain-containing protein n=1 Tax=Chondrinema litorale TaxID=2994555 RepID=UPI002543D93F|nr:helix-turn-helix domain-containing protein [Chondrinema litorale]UZR93786.1 helix-turn-helix domain-containing protein [Chondrinema litorale]